MTLTIAEIAADLKVNQDTVYKLINRGQLKAFRIGNRLRILELDYQAYKAEAVTRHQEAISK